MLRTRVCDLLDIAFPILQGGMLWIATAELAAAVSNAGALGVIAEGIEAGAHNGADELPLFALIPQMADEVSIPVIAAGGIADPRGVVAAFALGAEGVQLGTRFVAVNENAAHLNYKQAIVDAQDTDTVITTRSIVPTRCLKTEFTNTIIKLERSGAAADDIRELIGYRSNRTAQIDGDLNGGEAYCGASAGLIKEIVPAGDVVRHLVAGYEHVLKRLNE